ncbi:MAG TPA: cytochrome c oxidase subunit 3 [Candidatus Krumholzibacteria bacterium]|nr:cytochrome c oxidase subunit 3 [Candidatus Krumholzibacteria bacterium]
MGFEDDRGGGRAPSPAVSNATLGTALYVGAALMLFSGLISATLVLRAGAGTWPPAGQPRLPLLVSLANMLLLGASGFLVWRAHREPRHARRLRALQEGALLGAGFLCIQGIEWARLLAHGLRVSSSPYGATFYTLVGTHAVHVLGGLVALLLTVRRLRQGAGDVGACLLYWGFVVLLWPVLYVLVCSH